MKLKKENRLSNKKEIKALNPMILLAIIILMAAVATYIVPAGQFDRILDVNGRELVDPTSFHYIAQNPVGAFELFMSVTLGLQRAAYVIFFLFIIGGTFAVIEKTGAMYSFMGNVVKKMNGKELLMVPICMIVFGCGACFAGNFEEFLAFVPLMIAVCIAMGFDSLTALGIIFGAVAAGYGGAMTNPFTVGVAQGIAGLPMFSGMAVRGAVFVSLLSVSIAYVTWYAYRIKKNPQLSPVYESDLLYNSNLDTDNIPTVTLRHKMVLIVFLLSIFCLVYGVLELGFYIDELAALFLITGIVAGIVGGLKADEIADAFMKGCENLLFACVMIGMCNAAIIIMENASIMDTIINALAGLLKGLPPTLSACGMFVIQDIINILVPSGSGQAAITMPLMAPLGDLIGVSRQTTVLAFQMGDSFTNVIAPTGAELIAALAMAKIPYGKWVKWLLPLFAMWWVIAFISLSLAVTFNYGPF